MSMSDGQRILLDCCRKILQSPNIVKSVFLYNSRYLFYLNNKNHKAQITILSLSVMFSYDKIDIDEKFCLKSPKKTIH